MRNALDKAKRANLLIHASNVEGMAAKREETPRPGTKAPACLSDKFVRRQGPGGPDFGFMAFAMMALRPQTYDFT